MKIFHIHNWYWFVGGDLSQVYSSAARAMVPCDDATYQAWIAGGGAADPIVSMEALADVLRAHGVPPYHKVRTLTVVRRLTAAGLIDAADAALNANKPLWRQFYTAGTIDGDYADARGFIASIGGDPDEILAPE